MEKKKTTNGWHQLHSDACTESKCIYIVWRYVPSTYDNMVEPQMENGKRSNNWEWLCDIVMCEHKRPNPKKAPSTVLANASKRIGSSEDGYSHKLRHYVVTHEWEWHARCARSNIQKLQPQTDGWTRNIARREYPSFLRNSATNHNRYREHEQFNVM